AAPGGRFTGAGDDLHAPEDLYDGAAYGLYPDHAAADRAADRSPEAAARFERDAAERPADEARAEEARADEARADEARAGETPARGGEAADAARAFARLTTALSWLWGRAGRLTTRRPRPVEDEDLIAPALRQAFAQGAPLIAGAAAAAAVIAFPPTREAAVRTIDSLHRAVLSRPELAVRRIELIGAERVDATAVIAALGLTPDAHASLGFDAAEARDRIEALGWVKHARVALRPPQTLEIEVRERTPALLWRVDGRLWLLDPKGAKIEAPLSRRAWPGLPLVVGQDADKALDEAFQLDRAARLAGLPVAALTRIGARRWDLELVGGPRIRLPEDAPLDAVETAGRWAAERGILERGYELIDLRIAHAPVARLASAALGDRLQPGAAALSARETDEADAAADAAADLGEQVAETAPAHWRIPAPDIFQER
ncbi:MAG: FtsQ-type POTRA domain-containing protein, partial [Pseudomonadota bacterium]